MGGRHCGTNMDTKRLSLGALLFAMVIVATTIRIPAPAYRLYFNLGEAVIYTTALIWGARLGAIVGGIGSALADLILGYPIWAPFTLIIKGAEGYIVGALAERELTPQSGVGKPLLKKGAWREEPRGGEGDMVSREREPVEPAGRREGPNRRRMLMSILPGALVMIVGYAVSAWAIYGPAAVPIELGGDIIQCAVGTALSIPVASVLRRSFDVANREG